VVIKRTDGWKLLSGQTAIINNVRSEHVSDSL
jgi:hypothetical protein